MPPFYLAACDGNMDVLRQHPELVRVPHDGATALHYSALHGRIEAMEWLLEQGADPEARDDEFNATPVQWAHEKGQDQAVEWLLQRGAMIRPTDAAGFGKVELLAHYISERPELLVHEEEWGTLVHQTCIWGREEVLEWLIADGRADLRLRSRQGFTPLQICERQALYGCSHTPIVLDAKRVEIQAACERMAARLRSFQ